VSDQSPFLQYFLPRVGLVAGVVGALTGYLTVLVLVVTVDNDYVSQQLFSEVGQLFYSAMFVEMHRLRPGGPDSAASVAGYDGTYNALTDPGLSGIFTLPPVVYHAIPVVVFVLAGLALAWLAGARMPRAGAVVGVSIIPGTLLVAILGTVLFASPIGRPAFFQTIFIGGLLYPGALGALGGVAGSVLRSR
jgi:hypothetical protein